jgi:hypothetical protein
MQLRDAKSLEPKKNAANKEAARREEKIKNKRKREHRIRTGRYYR